PVGSISPSAAFAAIAASTALPPRFSISRPISVASGWLVATMPRFAITTDRVANRTRPITFVIAILVPIGGSNQGRTNERTRSPAPISSARADQLARDRAYRNLFTAVLAGQMQ